MTSLPIPVRLTRKSCLALTTLLLLVGTSGLLIAQQSRRDQFDAITLQHIPANQAAASLQSTFGDGVEVIPDPGKNRVLISADQATIDSVRQFVRSLDQPAPAMRERQDAGPYRPASFQQEAREVVAYRVRPNDLQRLAQWLRNSTAAESGMTVAVDDRIGQLLVVAGASVQQQVAAMMAQEGYQPASGQSEPNGQNSTQDLSSDPRVSRVYELQHLTWREFESELVRTWGNRLSVSSERDGEVVLVELPTPSGVSALMTIDRRAGQLLIEGPSTIVDAWERAIRSLDFAETGPNDDARWISTENADVNEIRKAVSYLRLTSATRGADGEVTSVIPLRGQDDPLQNDPVQDDPVQDDGAPTLPQDDPNAPQIDPNDLLQGQTQGLLGPVKITFVEELGLIVVEGNPADVEKVNAIINQIISVSFDTLPSVQYYALENVNSTAIAGVVQELYDQVFAPRQDPVTITPLVKPNALLLIGREEAVNSVVAFLRDLDAPAPPSNEFRVFYLKHMSAIDAKARIDEHYLGIAPATGFGGGQAQNQTTDIGTGLSVRVRATADYRSNAVVVSASPRDMAEIAAFLRSIDVSDGPASTNTVRIIRLKNSLAEELAPVLQDVLNGQLIGRGEGFNPSGTQGNLQQLQGGFGGTTQQLARIRSVMLELVTVDPLGQEILTKSGITFDVRVTADLNSNALIVQGAAENMDLIEKLVIELDRLPDAETILKVYTITNGDASKLLELLQALFGTDELLPLQSGTIGDSSTLVALRFAIDTRTNSLIVSGSEADLLVVESILIRLDTEDFEDRVTIVTRLHNASAVDVAAAIELWLDGRAELNSNEDLFSIYEQYDRTIIVVAEGASNSLIVSATESYMPEIEAVIASLDRRPPMVMIQVLLAQVALTDNEEFGFEAGIQDSLLFDRGASNIGFNFNQASIGNDAASFAGTRETLGAQGLSNLNIGRTNGTLGFGGLVLSASNESITLLLRALKQRNRLQILSRPQIMTVENLQGYVQVGQRVPYITDTTLSNFGQTNTTELIDVGVLLQVTPRVSPDGLMVLNVDATKSELGSEQDGVAISVTQNGDVIRSRAIDIITAQTTIMARTGQTVVIGGLIETQKADTMRGVPIISDIPALGRLFRFDSTTQERSELLIIMTPYLIESEDDIAMLNQVEMDRMSWCLADVAAVHGSIGYSDFDGYISSATPETVYPDFDPTGRGSTIEGQGLPTPEASYEQGQFYSEPGTIMNVPNGTSSRQMRNETGFVPQRESEWPRPSGNQLPPFNQNAVGPASNVANRQVRYGQDDAQFNRPNQRRLQPYTPIDDPSRRLPPLEPGANGPSAYTAQQSSYNGGQPSGEGRATISPQLRYR